MPNKKILIILKAASDFTQVYGKLGSNDSVLDFGCGTGETTLAIASGQLGNFGKPEKVKYLIRNQETSLDFNYVKPCKSFDIENKFLNSN